jgi:hypothetical protein
VVVVMLSDDVNNDDRDDDDGNDGESRYARTTTFQNINPNSITPTP